MAKIQLNGEPYKIYKDMSLAELLKELKISGDKIAVEVNGATVEKDKYKEKNLDEDDNIEIVHFIGGG